MDIDKIYTVDTFFLLEKMMQNNDYSYDVYFRMAVIDEYFKGNNKIWKLYDEMQYTRANMIKFVPKHMINNSEKFIQLINSFKLNGFIKNNPILINKKYMVIDGAHRMACSLYFNIPKITLITNKEFLEFIPNEYTKEWFLNNNLNKCIPYAEKQKEKVKKLINNV